MTVAFWPLLPGIAVTTVGAVAATALMATMTAVLTAAGMRATRPAPGRPHVAHAARPRLADYLPVLLRWWPLITIAISGACVAGYAADPVPDVAWGPGVMVAAWALGSLIVAANLGLAHRLATRPQPAGSAAELAVRNELTGDAIGELVVWPSLAWLPMSLPVISPPYNLVGRRRWRVRERLCNQRMPVVGT